MKYHKTKKLIFLYLYEDGGPTMDVLVSDVLAHFKRVCVFLEIVVQHASHEKEKTIYFPKVCKNDVMFKDHKVFRKHLV
jgi:hypothetical protein